MFVPDAAKGKAARARSRGEYELNGPQIAYAIVVLIRGYVLVD